MSHSHDHGKSLRSSGADAKHYSPSHEKHHESEPTPPTHAEIRERAYQIWVNQGSPEGRAEQHWLAAERELHDAAIEHTLAQINQR